MRVALLVGGLILALSVSACENADRLAEAAWLRGNAKLEQENFQQAIGDYSDALRARPDYAPALVSRGNAYLATQDYDAARADYDAAIRSAPDLLEAYEARATLSWLLGDLAHAEIDYRVLVGRRPSDAHYANKLAGVLYDQGKASEVEQFFANAFQQDRTRDWALLGWLLAIKETSGGAALLRQASELYNGGDSRMAVRYGLGEGYLAAGDYWNASVWLATLRDDDVTQTPPDAIADLAAAYVAMGRSDMCQSVWQDYMRRMGREHQYDPSQCS